MKCVLCDKDDQWVKMREIKGNPFPLHLECAITVLREYLADQWPKRLIAEQRKSPPTVSQYGGKVEYIIRGEDTIINEYDQAGKLRATRKAQDGT